MNTIQLECFLAVAEQLNFARAAQQLHITQPAVTHQINSLETELGTRLFRRTTRTVELTSTGYSFMSDARDILTLMENSKNRIASRDTEAVYEFHIGCNSQQELNLLPPILARMKEEESLFHPIIKQGTLAILRDQLQEETLQVLFGIREIPQEETRESSRDADAFLLLERASLSCVVSGTHPLAEKTSLAPEDLTEYSIMIGNPRQLPEAVTDTVNPLMNKRPPSLVYVCENMSIINTYARAGLGFSIVPDIVRLRDPDLVYISLKDTPHVDFGLFYKKNKVTPTLRRFISLVREAFEV